MNNVFNLLNNNYDKYYMYKNNVSYDKPKIINKFDKIKKKYNILSESDSDKITEYIFNQTKKIVELLSSSSFLFHDISSVNALININSVNKYRIIKKVKFFDKNCRLRNNEDIKKTAYLLIKFYIEKIINSNGGPSSSILKNCNYMLKKIEKSKSYEQNLYIQCLDEDLCKLLIFILDVNGNKIFKNYVWNIYSNITDDKKSKKRFNNNEIYSLSKKTEISSLHSLMLIDEICRKTIIKIEGQDSENFTKSLIEDLRQENLKKYDNAMEKKLIKNMECLNYYMQGKI